MWTDCRWTRVVDGLRILRKPHKGPSSKVCADVASFQGEMDDSGPCDGAQGFLNFCESKPVVRIDASKVIPKMGKIRILPRQDPQARLSSMGVGPVTVPESLSVAVERPSLEGISAG